MSCGKGNHHHPISSGNCVCDVVRAIADAQNEVEENVCDVSCERSIESLLDPAAANDLNTVPFILYGKDLNPFKGFGIDFKRTKHNLHDPEFECIESYIFRVKTVDDDCCAVLELLAFADDGGRGDSGRGDSGRGDSGRSESGRGGHRHRDDDSPCDQIDQQKLENLVATGICITVDLSCFCAITCLPAVSLP
ncbi:CotY/CotZ family spore coat protein [Calidifontibacillus erzurumensis]|uniref:CotY/CotZ family spore coat protein n=1 Tax=Calidifontibacillus erzurumensis TaxID=2741433 RepID=UPI0035B53009